MNERQNTKRAYWLSTGDELVYDGLVNTVESTKLMAGGRVVVISTNAYDYLEFDADQEVEVVN